MDIKNYVTEEVFYNFGQAYTQTYIHVVSQSKSLLDDRLLTIFSRVITLSNYVNILLGSHNQALLKGEIEECKEIQMQLKEFIIDLNERTQSI